MFTRDYTYTNDSCYSSYETKGVFVFEKYVWIASESDRSDAVTPFCCLFFHNESHKVRRYISYSVKRLWRCLTISNPISDYLHLHKTENPSPRRRPPLTTFFSTSTPLSSQPLRHRHLSPPPFSPPLQPPSSQPLSYALFFFSLYQLYLLFFVGFKWFYCWVGYKLIWVLFWLQKYTCYMLCLISLFKVGSI